MARGRQLKSQLRQYSTTSDNTTTTTTNVESSPTSSVTEKLTKLRIEQTRAQANRQRRYGNGTHSTQQLVVVDHDAQRRHPLNQVELAATLPTADSSTPSRRPAAGPPPPPSWVRPRPISTPSTASHALKRRQRNPSPLCFASLARLCCQQLSRTKPNDIKQLPIHVKQQLLFEWSFVDSLVTDRTMDLFEKTEYEELWLEASQVTLKRLLQAFWKVDRTVNEDEDDEPVDDWEDLQVKDDILPMFTLSLDDQQELGKWNDLYEIMMFLRPDMISTTSYTLSSPYLGQTLTSLNISFMDFKRRGLSWLNFAHLLVSTLPHLMWLYSSGCFDRIQGPQVVSILSHGMRKLKFWDLSYYDDWLLPSSIDWHRDLLELTTLCLSSSHPALIDRWFKEQHLSRIKLLWIQ